MIIIDCAVNAQQLTQHCFPAGADPNAESMLNTAAAAGQPELVTLLLDFGAMVSW